jgi:uncharacterized hydrophobic protein (TIGR00271 family)
MAEAKQIIEDVEEKASEELGIGRWDRPAIFREAADAATDSDLPYWTVLLLSGAIATLGLALDSSAVVIGAMLIAPLLSPVVGLALALAVGDGRLALQTAAAVAASTAGVIAVGALLTLSLPFQELTPEISARTRPTTLDLVIAVFSGLAGVVVTVARGHRLSAAIPGVAISVALIPPLAVAGFGIGIGWEGSLIRGSMLLYGANLAGIVLSGMLVFLLVGMHRPEVLEAVKRWHEQEKPTGLLARLDRIPWVRSLGLIRSTAARVGLVVAFVVALAIPLRRSLMEITREVRVRAAVGSAVEDLFQLPGRSSVLSQQLVPTDEGTQVFLRVATTEWFGDDARERFTRRASAAAGEPVRLVLEQLPASSGDIEQLAELIPTTRPRPAVPPPPPQAVGVPNLLASLRTRLGQAAGTLALPDGVAIAGMDLSINGAEGGELRLAYLAAEPLPPQAEQILSRQMARAVDAPGMRIALVRVAPGPTPAEESLDEVADLLLRYPSLRVEVAAEGTDTSGAAPAIVARLVGAGIPRERIDTRAAPAGGAASLRLRAAPAARPDSVPDETPR